MDLLRQVIRAIFIAIVSPLIGYGSMLILEELRVVTPSNFPKEAFFFSVVVLTLVAAGILFRLWPRQSGRR